MDFLKLAEGSCYLSFPRRRTQVVKGEVCKTSMQRFESARRLQFLQSCLAFFVVTQIQALHEKCFRSRLDSEQAIELAACVQIARVVVAADRFAVDEDLRHGAPL